ncbi:hypothetical protein BJ978_002675 [Agromyces terreus]|uniref:Transcriptional regulator, AbiEi antitoxin, Type IV TA system n=1 Tax=Agromyces terreus TaxID=424795 RepID=A0A9X2H9K8_9MICO|nr:hypothetical protein [Agromyces terreus]
MTVAEAEDAGVPAVEVRKLASRGVLRAYGHGVYTHREVPSSRFTEPAVAVALAGDGAFLHRDAVFTLLELGQFNPRAIRVGTRRRVRRTLPEWMSLEPRSDVSDDDLTQIDGIAATTVARALYDVRPQMPRERWTALVDDAERLQLLDVREGAELKSVAP